MVDNRSAGFFGIGGSFNFKSGDISGTAAKTQDDKMGQGGEYFAQRKKEEEEDQSDNRYMDRSAVLRATLNSLAMMNVANVINSKKKAISLDEKDESEEKNKKKNKKENNKEDIEQNTESIEEHIAGDEFFEFEDEEFDFASELDD